MNDNGDEKPKRKRGRGRPRRELSAQQVQNLAGIGCTVEEIAAVLDVSKDTLERNFAADIERGRENGKCSVRRQQWKLMKKGNVAMAIWLGKQLLKQRDRADVTSGDVPIKFHEMSFEGERNINRIEVAGGNGNGNGHH